MRMVELDSFAVNLEMWWTDRPLLDRVEAAAGAGFSLAEIWYWPRWDIDALARACREHGLSLAQIGGWDFEPRLCDADNLEGFRRGIAAAIEVAQRLGAPRINLNGPYLHPGEDAMVVRDGVIGALSAVAGMAEEEGVTLMVEPMNLRVDHPGYALPTSADVIAVCEAVGSPALGINWDLYHLQIGEGDLTGHLAEGIDHVAYVQIADHPGRHEPGTGEIDCGFVLAKARELGYRGPIGLECSPAGATDLAVARVKALNAAILREKKQETA
jgi:hydroxypyruvate isomerase